MKIKEKCFEVYINTLELKEKDIDELAVQFSALEHAYFAGFKAGELVGELKERFKLQGEDDVA